MDEAHSSLPAATHATPATKAQRPRRNVELKCRLPSLDDARRIAGTLCDGPPEVLRQTDTYYVVARGRLKLRQIEGGPAKLIAYERADEASSRASDYYLIPVADAASLHAGLAATLGVLVVVEKVREIFLYKNVRIHLDRVARLGTFLEFEAVLHDTAEIAAGETLLQYLSTEFHLAQADLIACSYSDLLLAAPA